MKKRVRCLYVMPLANNDKALQLDLQEALCGTFAWKQGWRIVKESYASLSFDDETTPNIFKQLVDICCTAPLSRFDVLLFAAQPCVDIPEEYVEQVIDWLRTNQVEAWSVVEGKLT